MIAGVVISHNSRQGGSPGSSYNHHDDILSPSQKGSLGGTPKGHCTQLIMHDM
jgi:hypothetical protein